MNSFSISWRLAWRSILRGGRWTALAIFCIAAGVATVVALRGLGLSIRDSLINNVRVDLKGDIRVSVRSSSQFANFFVNDDTASRFSDEALTLAQSWADERGGRMSAFALGGNKQIAAISEVTVGRPSFISTFYIDPQTYPPTGDILAQDPSGVPLSQLLQTPYSIVISQNMAQSQALKLGDQVRVSGTEQVFTVTGIVGAEHEAGIRDLFAAFFGFAYIKLEDAQSVINTNIRPDNLAFALPQRLPAREEYVAARDLLILTDAASFDTVSEALERNQIIAQILGDFIVVMGLGALLIGGVGIMNTLLVMVRRRTEQIAALKTIGLKARQIALIFLNEGLLLGGLGTLVGCVAGILLGSLVNRYGEAFLQQPLAWRIYPEALLYGIVLGMVTSAVFSIAPILTALQVRPATILRPTERAIPRLGCLHTLALMVLVTLTAGVLVGGVISPSFALVSSFSTATPFISGLLAVAISFSLLGILVLVLWVLVWIIGKLPAFGIIDIRLALRNLSVNRIRTATTLLALSAGMFALSIITFVGQGARELLNLQLARQVGGNVIAFPFAPGGLGQGISQFALDAALAGVEGIEYRNRLAVYEGRLMLVDGIDADDIQATVDPDDFNANAASFILGGFSQWDTSNPALYASVAPVSQGRTLSLEDRGKRVLVAPAEFASQLGVQVGSILTYSVDGEWLEFEVVGLTGTAGGGGAGFLANGLSGIGVLVPPDSLPAEPIFSIFTYQVEPEQVNAVLVALSTIRIPPTLSLDVTFIDTLISRLIDQFSAIPTLVGLLSLVAAAVIMANTVALATLERQKQIGVLRAIGLSQRRTLGILLWETAIVGGLSAFLGIGLSALAVAFFTGQAGTSLPLPSDARLTALALVLAAFSIALLATLLSAGSALRARVMEVLRYE